MLFFMHLIWEANWKYVLTFPAALMCVFLVLMLVPDVGLIFHATQPHVREAIAQFVVDALS